MRIKVAVIGAGSMGTNHIRVLRDLPEDLVKLVGIAETHEPRLQCAMKRFSVDGYRDYRQLIEQTHPDLVALVVPTCLHYEVAAFALNKGINVLIEKPIAANTHEALRLLEIAQRHNALIAVGHIERFNPAIMEVKRRMGASELGRIFHLYARRLGPFPSRILDVGVTLDLATHDIDVMRHLLDAEVVHTHAEIQCHLHREHEDLILGILRFANQAIGVLDVNWLTPTKIRELSITGEGGMYLVNYLTQDVYFYANDYSPTNWDALRSFTGVSEGTMTRLKIHKAEPLRLEYEDVLTALRDNRLPTVTGEDGLAALQIALRLTGTGQIAERVEDPMPMKIRLRSEV
jgi:UDP-N-acetylglucosamine 3-dehydrogenase